MGKRNNTNSFAKREEELAKALTSVGKPTDEKNKIDEIATEAVNESSKEEQTNTLETKQEMQPITNEEKKEVEIETVNNTEEQKIETNTETVVNKPEVKNNVTDLFTVKKKVKIRKRQKNLWLKEDNIDLLEKISKNTDFAEGELVDLLIENYLKMIKIK